MDVILPQIVMPQQSEVKPEYIPTLHEVNEIMDNIKVGEHDGIEGEYETRMAIFTNFVLGRKCVVIEGSRATGKTALIDVIGTFLPYPIELTAASDKADIYDAATLDSASHFIIPETNKISKNTEELLKDWGENKSTIYKTLDENRRIMRYEIKPKPYLSSKADENDQLFTDEFLSRITVTRTDSGVDQNIRVKNKIARAEELPYAIKEVDLNHIKRIQDYVKNLDSIKRYKFIHPAATIVQKAVPPLFPDCRRDIKKYLYNTYGITLFHYYDRIKTYNYSAKQMYVTPVDMWYNHIIFGKISIESAMKCNVIEKKIIEILNHSAKNTSDPRMTNKEIHSALLRNLLTPSTVTVKKYLKNLVKNGYIVQNEESKPYTYEVADFFKTDQAVIHLNWKEIVEYTKKTMMTSYPEIAQEYISRYCENDGLVAVHPFTGEEVNILEWEQDKVKLAPKPQKTLTQMPEKKVVNIGTDQIDINANQNKTGLVNTATEQDESEATEELKITDTDELIDVPDVEDLLNETETEQNKSESGSSITAEAVTGKQTNHEPKPLNSELAKSGIILPKEPINAQVIISKIKELDKENNGSGADVQELINYFADTDTDKKEFERKYLSSLLGDGEIFEITPGKVKVLD